jgi:histidyl-tRNA synthetase
MQIQKPKGTYDLTPKEAFQRTYLENFIRKIFDSYNYKEIRTPTFESTKLFKRSIGEETDIVSKEMYSFNEDEFTLKPEMTAPVIRAYVENRMFNDAPHHKLYYISNMFRRERPQAGRFREFSQFGAESIGSGEVTADAEMILLADTILRDIGLQNYKIRINSIGTVEERNVFIVSLREYLKGYTDELSNDSKRRLETNPLRILDSKGPRDIEILEGAPVLYDYLSDDSKKHFEKLLELLSLLSDKLIVDKKLVRGFDYYTSTTFEFVSSAIGSQNAILGGGRYDMLAEQLGAKPTPAIGFAAGFERLEMALKAESAFNPEENELLLFVCSAGENPRKRILQIVTSLRAQGIKCDTDFLGRSVKSQMKEADRLKAKYVIVLGDNEIESNSVDIKSMSDGNLRRIDGLDKIINYIER